MLFNLAIIVIVALGVSWLFERIKLPGLLGMILTGVFLGPSFCKFISKDVLDLSTELRSAALIVILIRAGLGINRQVLNRVGVSAIKMSFIPGLFEGAAIMALAHYCMGFSVSQAGILAFIVAAVSPAVIVPQMLQLKEEGYGKNKEVPTLVLAGASVDDVMAITLFGAFLGMETGEQTSLAWAIGKIPVSIILGALFGCALGFIIVKFFKSVKMRDTRKVIIFMVIAICLTKLEKAELFPIASLLGIMAMGFVILEKHDALAKRLAAKFNKIWVLAEVLLFVMIGAAVELDAVKEVGAIAFVIIFVGLVARSGGVWISLLKSELNNKERLFCVIAYWPKATVQAAIGAIPLAYGVPHGDKILAIAVLSIIITAPLGAIGIRTTSAKLLEKTPVPTG